MGQATISFLRQLPEEHYVQALEMQVMEWKKKIEDKRQAEKITRQPAYIYGRVLHFCADSIGETISELIEDIAKDDEDARPLDLGEVIFGEFSGIDFGEGYHEWGVFTARDGSKYTIQCGDEVGRIV